MQAVAGTIGADRVQDDAREAVLAALLGLDRSDRRHGVDAWDALRNPFELKTTTTKSGFGTARDFGVETIRAWKARYTVAAFGRGAGADFEVDEAWAFHPDDLAEWFRPHEERLSHHEAEGERCLIFMEAGGAPASVTEGFLDTWRKSARLNNPKISRAYCRRWGTLLGAPAEGALNEFVMLRPLMRGRQG